MKKRISVPFLAAAIVVLALLAVIVIAKPFPQKASAVFPEKLLELPCTVARESIDGAEKIDLTNDQKGALLNELETIQAVRRGTSCLLYTSDAASDGKIGPYDQYVYRFSFENQQEISMDDRGTLYTQKGGYTMTGDFSGVLDLLNGWF